MKKALHFFGFLSVTAFIVVACLNVTNHHSMPERMWQGLLLALLFLSTILLHPGREDYYHFINHLKLIAADFKLACISIVTTGLLITQVIIFTSAPFNGEGFNLLLGYFLAPVIIIITQHFIMNTRIEWIIEVAFMWIVLTLLFHFFSGDTLGWYFYGGFTVLAIYQGIRIRYGINNIAGLMLDATFALPVAIYMLVNSEPGRVEVNIEIVSLLTCMVAGALYLVLLHIADNRHNRMNETHYIYLTTVLFVCCAAFTTPYAAPEKALSYFFVLSSAIISGWGVFFKNRN